MPDKKSFVGNLEHSPVCLLHPRIRPIFHKKINKSGVWEFKNIQFSIPRRWWDKIAQMPILFTVEIYNFEFIFFQLNVFK